MVRRHWTPMRRKFTAMLKNIIKIQRFGGIDGHGRGWDAWRGSETGQACTNEYKKSLPHSCCYGDRLESIESPRSIEFWLLLSFLQLERITMIGHLVWLTDRRILFTRGNTSHMLHSCSQSPSVYVYIINLVLIVDCWQQYNWLGTICIRSIN